MAKREKNSRYENKKNDVTKLLENPLLQVKGYRDFIYLFEDYGDNNTYAKQSSSSWYCVKDPLRKNLLDLHLQGKITLGVYLHIKPEPGDFFNVSIKDFPRIQIPLPWTRFFVIDLDDHYTNRSYKITIPKEKMEFAKTKLTEEILKGGFNENQFLTVNSSGNSYHFWFGFKNEWPTITFRSKLKQIESQFFYHFYEKIGDQFQCKKEFRDTYGDCIFNLEYFPKQDDLFLFNHESVGIPIRLPGYHRKKKVFGKFLSNSDGSELKDISFFKNNLLSDDFIKNITFEKQVKDIRFHKLLMPLIKRFLTPKIDSNNLKKEKNVLIPKTKLPLKNCFLILKFQFEQFGFSRDHDVNVALFTHMMLKGWKKHEIHEYIKGITDKYDPKRTENMLKGIEKGLFYSANGRIKHPKCIPTLCSKKYNVCIGTMNCKNWILRDKDGKIKSDYRYWKEVNFRQYLNDIRKILPGCMTDFRGIDSIERRILHLLLMVITLKSVFSLNRNEIKMILIGYNKSVIESNKKCGENLNLNPEIIEDALNLVFNFDLDRIIIGCSWIQNYNFCKKDRDCQGIHYPVFNMIRKIRNRASKCGKYFQLKMKKSKFIKA
ncbi:MAG: hypothetical protein EAX96_06565 [Candidatus Lokiarchaeota archaeon]|nr:hypothetical protein [Candidatus Lokiarchaeota archaeon]